MNAYVGCFDSHQARKTSGQTTQARPASDFEKPVVDSFPPLPSDNQEPYASRLFDRQEETAASDDLRDGWKHREVWVNGRPESPPVRPNQDP